MKVPSLHPPAPLRTDAQSLKHHSVGGISLQGCNALEWVGCAAAVAGCTMLTGPALVACVASAAPGCVKCVT